MRVLGFTAACLAAVAVVAAEESQAVLRGSVADKAAGENGLVGAEFLAGIRAIISTDPQVPKDEVVSKPFMGSFTTVHGENDPALASTSYCLTDNGCGNPLAYTTSFIPLSMLGCNSFCYIDKDDKRFHRSTVYTTANPPPSYLCCSWASC